MNDHNDIPMNGSDLLYLFLDGEADAAEKEALFKAMASDHELQAEFEDAITMRHAIHQERANTIVPSTLTADLFTKAGFAVPTAAAGYAAAHSLSESAAGTWAAKLLSSTFLPWITAGITAVGALLLWNTAAEHNRLNTVQVVTPAQTTQQVSESDQSLVRRIELLERSKEQYLAQMNSQTIAATPKNVYIPYVPKGYALIPEQDIQSMQKQLASLTAATENLAAVRDRNSMMAIPEITTTSTSFEQQPSFSSNDAPRFAMPQESPITFEDKSDKFTFNLRAINGLQLFPNRFASAPDILFNNVALTALYEIDNNHAFGLDLGQETFPIFDVQSASTLEQRYSLVWGGISYRYRMNPISGLLDIQPYAQIVAGGTKYGPISRGLIGLSWQPHNRFSVSFGLEASAMMYNYQNKWFGAQKLGLSYGVNIHL